MGKAYEEFKVAYEALVKEKKETGKIVRRPPQPRPLEPQIWRAIAGAAVQFPTVNSMVYYFPQGHMDQASSPPQNLSPHVFSRSRILCNVSAVQFLADPITGEVFVKLDLVPLIDSFPDANPPQNPIANDAITSFVKIVTSSDTNYGEEFFIPDFCVESIFPPLEIDGYEITSQIIEATDVQGQSWAFFHLYHGSRHRLSVGWNSFVRCKKLITGDSVVFMKDSKNELFIGIRRVNNIDEEKENEKQQEENCKEGFSRNGKGKKLSPESVAEAAKLAALNKPFEVVYYPKATGWSDFVVNAETVNDALNIAWSPGMRVKMAVEMAVKTNDSVKMTSYQGLISSSFRPKNGPWQDSPWPMLQITWDEPEVLKNFEWVNPWQVELVPSLPPIKKFKADDGSWISTDDGGRLV